MHQPDARFKHQDYFPDTSRSAEIILPHVLQVTGPVRSVLDVGGGLGAWAAAFRRLGVPRVLCIDDPRIDPQDLVIDRESFIAWDMGRDFPAPIPVDLVVCLEFAEHLPGERSDQLVQFLTSCADLVIFSAAIPGQPSPHHMNEQPPEFWKGLFAGRGLVRFDCLRPRIIADERIPYWYRQNTYLFATDEAATARSLSSFPFDAIPDDFELVHSRVLGRYRRVQRRPSGMRALLRRLRSRPGKAR